MNDANLNSPQAQTVAARVLAHVNKYPTIIHRPDVIATTLGIREGLCRRCLEFHAAAGRLNRFMGAFVSLGYAQAAATPPAPKPQAQEPPPAHFEVKPAAELEKLAAESRQQAPAPAKKPQKSKDYKTGPRCLAILNRYPNRDFGYDDLLLALGETPGPPADTVTGALSRLAEQGLCQRTTRGRYAALEYRNGATASAPLAPAPPAPAPPGRPTPAPIASPTALGLLIEKRNELRAQLAGLDIAIKALGGE